MFPNLFINQPKLNPLKTNNLKSSLFTDISDQQEVSVIGGVLQNPFIDSENTKQKLKNLKGLTPQIKNANLDPNSHTTLN